MNNNIMLTNPEKQRYKNQILFDGVGETGQEKLKAASVLVVGAGRIGAPLLQYITAAGVGTIAILDDDAVNEENLNLQVLYGFQDLGKLKTIISKQILSSQNPYVNHEIINLRLKPENALDLISRFDIIADTTGNSSCSYLLNDACILKDKPWVFAAIHKGEGYVSSFNYNGSPSFRCAFPSKTEKKSGKEIGMFGVLPGIIGSLQASEIIKIITGIGEVLSGKMLIFNLLTNSISFESVQRNENNFSMVQLQNAY